MAKLWSGHAIKTLVNIVLYCYKNSGQYTTSRPGLTIAKIFKLQYSDDLRFSNSGARGLEKAH